MEASGPDAPLFIALDTLTKQLSIKVVKRAFVGLSDVECTAERVDPTGYPRGRTYALLATVVAAHEYVSIEDQTERVSSCALLDVFK